MSEPRVVVLCFAVGMTALVINSVVAYIAGREPAIFDGLAFLALLAGWVVCLSLAAVAIRNNRRQMRDRAEDYRIAIVVMRWQLADSASRRRPSAD